MPFTAEAVLRMAVWHEEVLRLIAACLQALDGKGSAHVLKTMPAGLAWAHVHNLSCAVCMIGKPLGIGKGRVLRGAKAQQIM
jgi:hypothetical protein